MVVINENPELDVHEEEKAKRQQLLEMDEQAKEKLVGHIKALNEPDIPEGDAVDRLDDMGMLWGGELPEGMAEQLIEAVKAGNPDHAVFDEFDRFNDEFIQEVEAEKELAYQEMMAEMALIEAKEAHTREFEEGRGQEKQQEISRGGHGR